MITPVSACKILHGSPSPRCEARIDKYFVGYFSLQFMDKGEVELFYDFRRHLLRAPCFWFCKPGPRIRFHATEEGWWSHRYFAFTGALPRQWLGQGLMNEAPVSCTAALVPGVIRRLDEIGQLRTENDPLAARQAVNLLEGLILEVERLRIGAGEKTPWADLVGKKWRAAMHRPMDYAAIAKKEGMALSTFRRIFRKETGMGPHRYVQGLRIEEARLLLEQGKKNQKEIATALGYTDVYHFNHDFRRRVGLPPAQYQATLMAKS